MEHSITTPWQMIKFDGQGFSDQEDEIVTETPLTIRINGDELATVVCSPDALEDLTVGFLAAEGLIRSVADIEQLIGRFVIGRSGMENLAVRERLSSALPVKLRQRAGADR